MPYASGRVIHDADAHIMEVPGFLEEHLEDNFIDLIGAGLAPELRAAA